MAFCRAFGGVAAWEGEGSPYSENSEEVTHQVVDRPTQGHRFLSRDYVQPQWVFDSANARVLMPVDLYEAGACCTLQRVTAAGSRESCSAFADATPSLASRTSRIGSSRTSLPGHNRIHVQLVCMPSGLID